jgi:hypothetical protein
MYPLAVDTMVTLLPDGRGGHPPREAGIAEDRVVDYTAEVVEVYRGPGPTDIVR